MRTWTPEQVAGAAVERVDESSLGPATRGEHGFVVAGEERSIFAPRRTAKLEPCGDVLGEIGLGSRRRLP